MIYAIQRKNGDIKIGTSKSFYNRVKLLRHSFGPIKFLGWIDGSYHEEALLLERFRNYRVARADFFSPSKELLHFIFFEMQRPGKLGYDSDGFRLKFAKEKKQKPKVLRPKQERKRRSPGENIVITVPRKVKIAMAMYAGEIQSQTGEALTFSQAVSRFLQECRPDMAELAVKLLREQSND